MYIKITCSNGFCGCEEEFYEEVDNKDEARNLANDILDNDYAFAEPDGRFLPGASSFNDTDYEEYDEEYDDYVKNLEVWWEEITEEEFEDNK